MNLRQSTLTQEELTGMGEAAEISHSSRSAGLQSCSSLLSAASLSLGKLLKKQ